MILILKKRNLHQENELDFGLDLDFRRVTVIKIVANVFFTHHTSTYIQDQRFDHIGHFFKIDKSLLSADIPSQLTLKIKNS